MNSYKPKYLYLTLDKLKKRSQIAIDLLYPCRVCPRNCGINRQENQKGYCGAGRLAVVNSYDPHFGEEKILVGQHGSGTIFFSACNLSCVYCQNFDISQHVNGTVMDTKGLAKAMLNLQSMGCHNINLVSPTIWAPQILEALPIAIEKGLRIPLVYNSGGYDSLETLKILDGIIDIYMPDIKYSNNDNSMKYSNVKNYFETTKRAIKEMHNQVGDLIIDEYGIALKGLLIRHLVLPNNLAGSKIIINFLAKLSKDTYVNIMPQYYPTYKAYKYPELSRGITPEEFITVIDYAKEKGLYRFDKII